MKLNLDKIHDPNRLREIARLALSEADQLLRQMEKLSRRLDELEGQDTRTLQLELEKLQQALNGSSRGKAASNKSERRRAHRRKKKAEKEPETGGARNDQPALVTEEKLFELSEDELICPCCGGIAALMEGAEETSEVVDVIRREFTIVKARRQKAVHGCDCAPSKIVCAPGPVKLVPKGRFSIDFGVSVAVAKFHDHLPLELQATQMKRDGLNVRPDVLQNQLEYLAEGCKPSYEAIRHAILAAPSVHIDDTSWPMLEVGKQNWHVFGLCTPQLTYLKITRRKTHQQVIELLTHPENGPFGGNLMCDGASNFKKARDKLDTFELIQDWSHARRKFIEAEPDYPQANEVLDLIDELYAIERDADTEDDPLEARARLRSERSASELKKIRLWLRDNATSWDGSSLNGAIRYTDRRWDELTKFVKDPTIPLHNNPAEFALRKPVRGRKNFHGTKTRNGARIAAIMYTMCESARKNRLDPHDYLREVFLRHLRVPGQVTLPTDLP